jgi:BatD DUF11 like domain
MRARSSIWIMAGVLSVACMAGAAPVAAPSVDTTIEPAQIALGESARLTILTSGGGTLSVKLPEVAGLEFRVVGQTRSIQIINGRTIESTSTIVKVTPEVAGIFTIPGLTPASPPLVLRVSPDNGGAPAPAPNNPAPPDLGALVRGGANADGIRLTPDGSAFVRLQTPKREVYVGESVPVEIQVGMRDGFVASINGLPQLNSGDFTLNNLSRQPLRAAKVIEGKPFTVVTWQSVLAAIKPGKFSLTFETPLTVKIRTRPQRDLMLDDLLGDPFMQNIFGATVTKSIKATSPEETLTVLPLPTEGRPAEFGGAVGNFRISTDISSATNTAGDPLTLRMHVNGAGNFDRVESSMLKPGDQWKTYGPKATFNPVDGIGYRGEKLFEQPLIAAKPGTLTIPALTFEYFDPDSGHYETARSAPLTVTVAAPAAGSAATLAANAAGAAAAANSGLKPDHAASGPLANTLIPLYLQPRFLTVPSVLALLLSGGWMALRRQAQHASQQQERERARRLQSALWQMSAAAAGGEATPFFNAARLGLQQALGERWRLAPEQVTVADIETRLGEEEARGIRQIFALADEANYSGDDLQSADFERWTQVVRRQLNEEWPA